MASSRYISHGLNLTDNQLEKIIRASQNKQGVVVRITKDNLNGNSHKIPLTKTQINRITKAKNGLNLSLSSSQLKYLKKSGGLLPLLALLPLIFAGLGAAGGVAGGVASAVSSAKNASAAAAQIAEMERHNREIESQLKSGANAANNISGAGVGNGIISDAASRIPVVGPFIVPILKRLGLGLADINTITKGGCVSCNGICFKTVGGGLFIETGKGLNLGTQNAGQWSFFRAKAPMMTSFEEFVVALFKDIQPFSNFDIIRICKKLKISNFRGCFMRDEIKSFCGNDECFILNTDVSSSSGTHWVAVNINEGTTYYFDSFCLEPIEEIKRYCKEPRFYNSFEFHKPNEVIFGHLCLYSLYRMRYCEQDFYSALDELYCK